MFKYILLIVITFIFGALMLSQVDMASAKSNNGKPSTSAQTPKSKPASRPNNKLSSSSFELLTIDFTR